MTKPTEPTEPTEPTAGDEIHTIKLGEKSYAADSVTEHGNNLLLDLQKVEGLLSQQKLAVSVTQLAKGKLIEEITKEAVNFKEIEVAAEPEAANDSV